MPNFVPDVTSKGLPGKDGLDGLPGNDGATVSATFSFFLFFSFAFHVHSEQNLQLHFKAVVVRKEKYSSNPNFFSAF